MNKNLGGITMKKMFTISAALLAALSLAACGNSASSTNNSSSSSVKKTHSQYYFDGKTANLHDLKIHIDHVQFYQASEETNNKNLICFDYTITNKTDKDINAITGWQAAFNAYQDNKNTEGKLEVGALPSDTSDQILHDQTQTIKKNGTVKCRATYELDSTSKPVVLKATQGVDGKFLGKKTFKIKKLSSQEQGNKSSNSNLNSESSEDKISKADKVSNSSKSDKSDQVTNNGSTDSADKSSSAYYASLQKANDDYWKNLTPQEKAEWDQWSAGESRANDPYQNGYYNSVSSSAPAAQQ